jgi:Tol biopolymer transport system component/tRNA A-37 threonylcarbamoyl transferase component Bud32
MSRTLQPEDRISHYRIVGPLGAGGMGEVYIAQDETLGRSVALKILPPQLVRNEERLRRFITEAKSASSLNHPNIVTIHEIGQDAVKIGGDPVHFISMELVSGETLGHKIHEERADVKTLLGWLAQAAEGVAKAHSAGIVHRDLKPGNIMVSKDGFAKVLDFGLAKLTDRQADTSEGLTSAPTEAKTGAGTVMGTVGYMSPEQVQGKPVDYRSDIFSIGCILYEAVTRTRPFAADTDVETMHRILRERPAPVETLNPEAPAEVRRLIRRCLAKSPDQRFQSMKDLAIDLREVVDEYDSLSASGTSGGTVTSGALGARPARRMGVVAGIAAAALVGVGGLAVGLYGILGKGRPESASGRAAQQMKLATLMSRNDLGEAVLSGDGRYLAYVTSSGDRSSLNVRQVRTGSDVQILPPQEFGFRGISFSPDGDYLYFLNRDPQSPNYGALFQVPSLGGTPRKIAFDVDTAVTFSPDGKSFCFRRGLFEQGDALFIADSETGKERELGRVRLPETLHALNLIPAPDWSPDGKRIAVAVTSPVGGMHTSIATFDVASGERKNLGAQNWLIADSLRWLPDGAGVVLSAVAIGFRNSQLYQVSYPAGESRRMTNDLDGYQDVSISSDGASIAAVRRTGVSNIYSIPAVSGGEPQPLTFATGGAASVEFFAPLAGGPIAFSAARGEAMFVWRLEPDGTGRRQLTSQGVYVVNMAFSEGAGIVFTQAEKSGLAHVWRIDPEGGGLMQLTDGAGEVMIAASETGKTVFFVRTDKPGTLWAVDAGGGPSKQTLSEFHGEVATTGDGSRLMYTNMEEVKGRQYPRRFVVPAEGGEPLASFLLPPGTQDLKWSPEGESLTYIDRDQGYNLMRRSIAKSDAEQLTHFPEGRLRSHAWSPDGRKVVLHRRLGQQDSLWLLDAKAGAQPSKLTEFKSGRIFNAQWARDSKSVVFTYGSEGQDVVLITDFR